MPSIADLARSRGATGSWDEPEGFKGILGKIAAALHGAEQFAGSSLAKGRGRGLANPVEAMLLESVAAPRRVMEREAYDKPHFGGDTIGDRFQATTDVLSLGLPALQGAGALGRGLARELLSPGQTGLVGPALQAGKVGKDVKPKQLKRLADEFVSPEAAAEAAVTPPKLAPKAHEIPKDTGLAKTFQSGEKEGMIRGTQAFGGITPEQALKMREGYVARAQKGVPGKYWYDDTSEDIFRVAGEDVSLADKFTEALSSTSSRTPVGSNLAYGVRGHNQYMMSDPVSTGGFPKRMSKEITGFYDDANSQVTGFKRSPFAGGLQVHWRPNDTLRPVHDIHDVRAQGIVDPKTGKAWNKGVGEAGHRFLDEQTAEAAKTLNRSAAAKIRAARKAGTPESEIAEMVQDDWNNFRTQAAGWVAQKAEKEGVPVAEMSKHYGDFINEYSAVITREWAPGKTTGHAQELLKSPQAVQKDFSDAMEAHVRGPQGIDAIAHDLGALTDTTLINRGEYQGVTAPGYSSRVLVGKGKGSQDIDSSSAKFLDTIAATHGLFGVQDQVAWNYLGGKAPIKSGTALQFKRGSPFLPDELEQLSRLGIGDVPQVDPTGARMLVFTDPGEKASKATLAFGPPEKKIADLAANAESRSEMMKKARAAGEQFGADVEMKNRTSNLFPMDDNYNAPEKWSAGPFVEKIEAGGPRAVEKWNEKMPARAAALLQTFEQKAAEHGLTAAPFYKPMMEGIARGGLSELKRLRAAGIVPAAALAAMGLDRMLDDEQQ